MSKRTEPTAVINATDLLTLPTKVQKCSMLAANAMQVNIIKKAVC